MKAVETTSGTIECQHFVNCAGFWARNVGKLSEPYVKVSIQCRKAMEKMCQQKKKCIACIIIAGTTSSGGTLLLAH